MTTPRKCPICGKPESPDARPFCSPRCAQIDLGRWLNESYRVPDTGEDEPMLQDDDTG